MVGDIQIYLCTLRNSLYREAVTAGMGEELISVCRLPAQRFTRVLQWAGTASAKVFEDDPVRAGEILDVIHNLPFEGNEWSEASRSYFFRAELPSFLESNDDCSLADSLIEALGKDIEEWRTLSGS
jgi:hypothetical protein